jgi:hypothetical protein
MPSIETPGRDPGSPTVLAVVAHPDDIEFIAAGTLLLLREAGWAVHCLNLSGGDLGSMTSDRNETRQIRAAEGRSSAPRSTPASPTTCASSTRSGCCAGWRP